jgi:prolyl-tRNA synthetase
MGSYGIGVGRLLACIAEEHNDERGLIWPITIAPYQIHLVALKGGEEAANSLYIALESNGFEVLYDDRDESPGVKFNDADLIGIPIRLTVSKRSLKQGGVELKFRQEPQLIFVPLNEVPQRVKAEITTLETAIAKKVVEMKYTA